MTVSTLLNYQFAWNNFLFGNGTPHTLQSIDGLQGLPAIRNQDEDQGFNDGMFTGNDFLSGRTITINLQTFATAGGNTAQQNFYLLKTALLPQSSGTTPLQFRLSGSNLQRVNARVRTSLVNLDFNYTAGMITSQWSLFCPDPKIYDDTLQTTTLTVTVGTIGRGYPRTYPMLYGGGSNATLATLSNAGWANSYPVITINGPVTNPTVGNYSTGQAITLSGSFTLSDVIVIDTALRLITKNGTSARNLITGTSSWFSLPAGASQFYFSGFGTSNGVTSASCSFRNAYL